MKILVINSGSSSIKYKFFDMAISASLCKGLVERIGTSSSILSHQKDEAKPSILKIEAKDHNQAIKHILRVLTNPSLGVISSYKDISAIGHRVVHGAEAFREPTIIDTKVLRVLEKYNELAPLHNPPAILGIKACQRFAKKLMQVAVFDTAFHQTLPKKAYTYAIPLEFYNELGIRRYGFHGTSHKFVAYQASRILKKDIKRLKLVTCHIGNGCSVTAVNQGASVDTSMGFTPLEGLVMGTRSGDIDPAVLLYIMEKKGYDKGQINTLLNKKSGLLGLSGLSNDMRDVVTAMNNGNKRAKLAVDVFIYRIKKYIGAYAAVMDGIDAVVLTAGIGENLPLLKNRISQELRGFLNSFRARLLVIQTDEELMIARETAGVVRKKK
ncbi:MAG: acetate kinase [Candidatus Omnitrophota bacterium]